MNKIIIKQKAVAPISLIKGTGNITLSGGGGSAEWNEIIGKPSWIGSSKPTYTASEVGAIANGGDGTINNLYVNGTARFGTAEEWLGISGSTVWTYNTVFEINTWCDGGGRIILGNDGMDLQGVWLQGHTKVSDTLAVGGGYTFQEFDNSVKFSVRGGTSVLYDLVKMAEGTLEVYRSNGDVRLDYSTEYFSINNWGKNIRMTLCPDNALRLSNMWLSVDGDITTNGRLVCSGFVSKGNEGENDYIKSVINPDGILQEKYGANASISNAISFNWYNSDYQIGIVRGGSTNSQGFGITKSNNDILACFEQERTVIFKDLHTYGGINMRGSNQINDRTGGTSLALNFDCWGNKGVEIFDGVCNRVASFNMQGSKETQFYGRINLAQNNDTSYIDGAMDDARCIQAERQTQYSFHPVIVMKSNRNARLVLGGIDEEMGFYAYTKERIEDTAENGYDDKLVYTAHNRNWNIRCPNMVHIDAPTCNVTGQMLVSGNVIAYNNSDRRLKKDIEALNPKSCLDAIIKLIPSSYKWDKTKGMYTEHFDDSTEYGLIAQDVEDVLPEAVKEIFGGKYKGIDYKQLIPMLIGSIQSLNDEIKKLKNVSTK